ncbi:MarR family winged helix-turn-helix transcriptional regulator [Roseateles terrae]|uniref:DNA-binding MarR family transcriptional regulator n=1 Tax=Roseateles terrae TaxID=431060 RepID=A0ABR6GSN6_9BURK|nr:MarR family transcriptional regulator [Roseateles terrae]MBB3195116.1 DNA-binding MarR family transcriptional regulator [Roseateles terrae]
MAESLRDVVGRLVRAVRQASGTQSSAQGDALAQLDRNGPVSVAALADSRGVSHQSMRLVVGRMEALGQVERRPDPADGRGFLVELTPAGQAEAAAGRRRRTQWLAQAITAQFTQQEQDTLRAAVVLLDRLVEAGPAE